MVAKVYPVGLWGFFFFKACGVTFAKYLLYIDVIIVKFSHETDINHKQINLLHLNTIYLLQECQGEEYEEKQHLFTCVYCLAGEEKYTECAIKMCREQQWNVIRFVVSSMINHISTTTDISFFRNDRRNMKGSSISLPVSSVFLIKINIQSKLSKYAENSNVA